MQLVLTTELLLEAYRQGLFPMAYNAYSPYIQWVCPNMRGQISITDMHIPRSLRKAVKQAPYEIRVDSAFDEVIEYCAQPHDNRPETWINDQILEAYKTLHSDGHAHSVEAWQDGALVGGLYGLKIGGAFFGESMFSRATNASKITLVHLAARLWKGGFSLLDTQFTNAHLEQFGVYEVPHARYKEQLSYAINKQADFALDGLLERDVILEYLAFRESRE